MLQRRTRLSRYLKGSTSATESKLSKVLEAVISYSKPGLKIMPRDKNKFVYLIGLQGPLFKINLAPGKFCVIKNVIIVHSAQISADKVTNIVANPD
jgi:hypothetical protein